MQTNAEIINEYLKYIEQKDFPCIAAKAALNKQQLKCMVADHIGCPKDDVQILKFLSEFVDDYRVSKTFYHSAAIIFKQPENLAEQAFDDLFWKKLQSLSNLDAQCHKYDSRVDKNPASPSFSFSINEEAFYIIGLHPLNSRHSRRFKYATLVFNPHEQFENLKTTGKYDTMKKAVRKRDIALSGSVNPMLKDFGVASEVFQYSGQKYDENWKCPLIIKHF